MTMRAIEKSIMTLLDITYDSELERILYSFMHAQLNIAEKFDNEEQQGPIEPELVPLGSRLDVELQTGTSQLGLLRERKN